MLYGIYSGLVVLSLLAMVGSNMRASRFTMLIAIFTGLSQLLLIVCAFWQYGWRQGVLILLFVVFLLIVTEVVVFMLTPRKEPPQ